MVSTRNPPNLGAWLKAAKQLHQENLAQPVKIVGIIGKDYPDHGKGETINNYIDKNVFPVATRENLMDISIHFSETDQILFLILNGLDDVATLKNMFKEENGSFLQKMSENEEKLLKMLHFLFITCHFVIVFEATSRIDLEFFRLLRRVNTLRSFKKQEVDKMLAENELKNVWFTNRSISNAEREGRILIPRLLVAFQRNNIRYDLGSNKKRETYEKLEKSLDCQLSDVLTYFELINADSDSLFQLNETLPFVHLINPKIIKRDVIEEMLDFFTQQNDSELSQLPSNQSLHKFFDENFKSEKAVAKLENVIDALNSIFSTVFQGTSGKIDKKHMIYANFENHLLNLHLTEAFKIYERNLTQRGLRTRADHELRFGEAARYLRQVCGSRLEWAMEELQRKCDEIWKSDRACEQVSLTGVTCRVKVHPTFGDETCAENRWTPHDSFDTLISTCPCGTRQILRPDPFSVKEANFDFFDNNPEFVCCKRLEKFRFDVYAEEEDGEKDEWNNWADRDRESNSLITKNQSSAAAPPENAENEQSVIINEPPTNEEEESTEDEDYALEQRSQSTTSSDDLYTRPRSRKDSTKTNREIAADYAKRLNLLRKSEKTGWLDGVPNNLSISQGLLPLFPSWILTCLGESSLYNHHSGVRNQPNFKIGGEYLIPALVFVDCDLDVWNRDLERIKNEDSYRRFTAKTPKNGEETPKVKLFLGFEYECSRGHRFFVDHQGEPFICARGSNISREAARRGSLSDILTADLPLRRACTCRKPPPKSAQLMKIHVVTPKAPVKITIDPVVLVPGQPGTEYRTGQAPLELAHSKYYILQLPMTYSSPSGTYIHDPTNLEKCGILKGGAISVAYKPILSFRW
ncbi:unnamed protein product [Caenorhabditis angaria]|uniref:Nonsense-mediated mRNA decay factor SMG8 n=1 Tax=Caenorhabditis angaria TaxID=860376 RepID=A0A9P1MW57_9PELO|nr:unnamed protein product [Caenorhabditis angaria]